MENKINIVLWLTIIFILFFGFYFYQKKSYIDIPQSENIYSLIKKEKGKYLRYLQEKGPKETLLQINNDYRGKPLLFTHAISHLWGEILYQQNSISGIKYCDDLGQWGCLHQIYAEVLRDKGIGAIKELDSLCNKVYTNIANNCHHGIGHALVDFFGHDKLRQALDACISVNQTDPLHTGCWAGAFMEYNMYTIANLHQKKQQVRILNPENPFEPCDSIAGKYRPTCFYRISQWWNYVYEKDYLIMGKLCDQQTETNIKEACFRGIGFDVAKTVEFEMDKVIENCNKMPSVEDKNFCQTEAAWATSYEKGKSEAKKICQKLSVQIGKQCMDRIE